MPVLHSLVQLSRALLLLFLASNLSAVQAGDPFDSPVYDPRTSEFDQYFEDVLERLQGSDYEDDWMPYKNFGPNPSRILSLYGTQIFNDYRNEIIPFEDLDDFLEWFEYDPFSVLGIGILAGTGIAIAISNDYITSIDIPDVELFKQNLSETELSINISGEWDWKEIESDLELSLSVIKELDSHGISIDCKVDLNVDGDILSGEASVDVEVSY